MTALVTSPSQQSAANSTWAALSSARPVSAQKAIPRQCTRPHRPLVFGRPYGQTTPAGCMDPERREMLKGEMLPEETAPFGFIEGAVTMRQVLTAAAASPPPVAIADKPWSAAGMAPKPMLEATLPLLASDRSSDRSGDRSALLPSDRLAARTAPKHHTLNNSLSHTAHEMNAMEQLEAALGGFETQVANAIAAGDAASTSAAAAAADAVAETKTVPPPYTPKAASGRTGLTGSPDRDHRWGVASPGISNSLSRLAVGRSVWKPDLFLAAREEIGQSDAVAFSALNKCVIQNTQTCIAQGHYVDNEGNTIDLKRVLPVLPRVQWFGERSLEMPLGIPSEKEVHGKNAPPLLFSDRQPLDIAVGLRANAQDRPIVVVVEANAFDEEGGIETSRLHSVRPGEMLLRTDFSRFAKQAKAHLRDGKATLQEHICAWQDPFLIYCEELSVLRGSPDLGYPYLASPPKVSAVVTSPTEKRPFMVHRTAISRNKPTEFYANPGDHMALVNRLELIALAAMQEVPNFRASVRRSKTHDGLSRPDDLPTLILSVSSMYPRGALANVLKHFRRQFAPLFHSIFVCCVDQHKSEPDLAEFLDPIVNKHVHAVVKNQRTVDDLLAWHWDEKELHWTINRGARLREDRASVMKFHQAQEKQTERLGDVLHKLEDSGAVSLSAHHHLHGEEEKIRDIKEEDEQADFMEHDRKTHGKEMLGATTGADAIMKRASLRIEHQKCAQDCLAVLHGEVLSEEEDSDILEFGGAEEESGDEDDLDFGNYGAKSQKLGSIVQAAVAKNKKMASMQKQMGMQFEMQGDTTERDEFKELLCAEVSNANFSHGRGSIMKGLAPGKRVPKDPKRVLPQTNTDHKVEKVQTVMEMAGADGKTRTYSVHAGTAMMLMKKFTTNETDQGENGEETNDEQAEGAQTSEKKSARGELEPGMEKRLKREQRRQEKLQKRAARREAKEAKRAERDAQKRADSRAPDSAEDTDLPIALMSKPSAPGYPDSRASTCTPGVNDSLMSHAGTPSPPLARASTTSKASMVVAAPTIQKLALFSGEGLRRHSTSDLPDRSFNISFSEPNTPKMRQIAKPDTPSASPKHVNRQRRHSCQLEDRGALRTYTEQELSAKIEEIKAIAMNRLRAKGKRSKNLAERNKRQMQGPPRKSNIRACIGDAAILAVDGQREQRNERPGEKSTARQEEVRRSIRAQLLARKSASEQAGGTYASKRSSLPSTPVARSFTPRSSLPPSFVSSPASPSAPASQAHVTVSDAALFMEEIPSPPKSEQDARKVRPNGLKQATKQFTFGAAQKMSIYAGTGNNPVQSAQQAETKEQKPMSPGPKDALKFLDEEQADLSGFAAQIGEKLNTYSATKTRAVHGGVRARLNT
eukprot:gnl/TRDRNA2_/TRDRNA2_170854_c6_seq1.p1 gnl/TRDRNA2_/TRDRNA2_170854_c6~~gnl/TRDRNA2_/TRDRNA2_170854_c6_seq1.p1  ORF type:complete len:1375 (+),score=234.17 gnl/TRDRNA2_/TRDRNA2_170854_c6_seq1:37-4161(+)